MHLRCSINKMYIGETGFSLNMRYFCDS